jgi:hypothetical protein
VPLLFWAVGIAGAACLGAWSRALPNPTRRIRPSEEGAQSGWPLAAYLAIFGTLVFGFSLWLSVSSNLPRTLVWVLREIPHVPRFVGILQFGYRLVSYQNLALVVLATAVSWKPWSRNLPSSRLQAVCWFAVGLAAGSAALKATESCVYPESTPYWHSEEAILALPSSYISAADYTIPGTVRTSVEQWQLPKRKVDLMVMGGRRFGEVMPTELTLDSATLVTLNISLFPWNQIYLDGRPIPVAELIRHDYKAAVRLDKGRHVIEYRFQPESAWSFLRIVSFSILVLLVLACLAGQMTNPGSAPCGNMPPDNAGPSPCR